MIKNKNGYYTSKKHMKTGIKLFFSYPYNKSKFPAREFFTKKNLTKKPNGGVNSDS
jgi:hypothetical protein